jgi:hypothetical protein
MVKHGDASLREPSPMSIHPIVARFARAERLPTREVKACRDNRAGVLPVFIDILVRAASRSQLSDEEDLALVYIVHLLGEFAEPAAFGPLVAFLRGDPERANDALGESVTETLNGILISTFDGNRGLLEDLIEDTGVDQFVRAAALEAWTRLVTIGRIEREHAERFLAECASTRLPRDSGFIWTTWMLSVAFLGVAGLCEEARRACEDGRVGPMDMNYGDFEQIWSESRASTNIFDALDREGWRPFTDALAEFQTWYCFSDAYRSEQREKEIADRQRDTVFNPSRHIGRNDPCPCGSGKKFKKCCGA